MGEGERHNDEVTKLQRSTYVKMQMQKELKVEEKLVQSNYVSYDSYTMKEIGKLVHQRGEGWKRAR